MPVDNVLARRKWQQGDWPTDPQRGIDGRMYGPGAAADPTDGTDSSPVQQMYGSSWLDNVIKLADNGMLHPKVLQMLEPQIKAMIKSQSARGQSFGDDDATDNGGMMKLGGPDRNLSGSERPTYYDDVEGPGADERRATGNANTRDIQGYLDGMHDRGGWSRGDTPGAEELTGKMVGGLYRYNKAKDAHQRRMRSR